MEECRPCIVVSNCMGSIRKEKIGFQKTVPRRPFAREGGGGGSKAIWAMPIYIDHISRRGFPHRFVFSFHSLSKYYGRNQNTPFQPNLFAMEVVWIRSLPFQAPAALHPLISAQVPCPPSGESAYFVPPLLICRSRDH